MGIKAECRFQIENWSEQTIQQAEGGITLARAQVAQKYEGVMEGSSEIEYQLAYTPSGRVPFLGFEWFTGKIGGKKGTAMLRHVGVFDEGKARSEWAFVEGAGTGELVSLKGKGAYIAGHGEPSEVKFSYSFE